MTLGLPRLSIETPEGGGILRDAVVKLDGWEVPGLRSLTLTMADDEINVVTLTIGVGEVVVSDEVIAQLQAFMDGR